MQMSSTRRPAFDAALVEFPSFPEQSLTDPLFDPLKKGLTQMPAMRLSRNADRGDSRSQGFANARQNQSPMTMFSYHL